MDLADERENDEQQDRETSGQDIVRGDEVPLSTRDVSFPSPDVTVMAALFKPLPEADENECPDKIGKSLKSKSEISSGADAEGKAGDEADQNVTEG